MRVNSVSFLQGATTVCPLLILWLDAAVQFQIGEYLQFVVVEPKFPLSFFFFFFLCFQVWRTFSSSLTQTKHNKTKQMETKHNKNTFSRQSSRNVGFCYLYPPENKVRRGYFTMQDYTVSQVTSKTACSYLTEHLLRNRKNQY